MIFCPDHLNCLDGVGISAAYFYVMPMGLKDSNYMPLTSTYFLITVKMHDLLSFSSNMQNYHI